jgi:hypothetical protein
MTLRTWVTSVVVGTVLVVSAVSAVQAQTVTFSDINDAVSSKFFDAATSAADRFNGNKLIIGFNKGTDLKTWMYKTFTASTSAFYHSAATDTISFRVTAPAGYYVSRITYTQRGAGSIARSGTAAGSANWVVDDHAIDLGSFGTNPTLSRSADLTAEPRSMVPVSITSSLFTFAPVGLGSATISLTSAEVLVEVLPLPSCDGDCD